MDQGLKNKLKNFEQILKLKLIKGIHSKYSASENQRRQYDKCSK